MGWREFKAGVESLSTKIGKAGLRFLDDSGGPVRVVRDAPLTSLGENRPDVPRVIPVGIRLSKANIPGVRIGELSPIRVGELIVLLDEKLGPDSAIKARATVDEWRNGRGRR